MTNDKEKKRCIYCGEFLPDDGLNLPDYCSITCAVDDAAFESEDYMEECYEEGE